jgi:hypothetical protein
VRHTRKQHAVEGRNSTHGGQPGSRSRDSDGCAADFRHSFIEARKVCSSQMSAVGGPNTNVAGRGQAGMWASPQASPSSARAERHVPTTSVRRVTSLLSRSIAWSQYTFSTRSTAERNHITDLDVQSIDEHAVDQQLDDRSAPFERSALKTNSYGCSKVSTRAASVWSRFGTRRAESN